MSSERISTNELYMSVARLISERGTCLRAKVGAVIVYDRRIVSTGYVGSPPGHAHCLDVGCIAGPDGGCIATIHAEANAIAFAARAGVAIRDSVLYSTHSPCRACAQLILSAGIAQVYYHHLYRDEYAFAILGKRISQYAS